PKEIAIDNPEIMKANSELSSVAKALRVEYIDVFSKMGGLGKELPENMTDDGIHLLGPGYEVWLDCLRPFLDKMAL
ncbi:MAG: sialate O-acetylesterase, partial [Deltaproteobacteria bacterium]|nr:sialate O-acetylesterase [Deltaproteobacteria bacterium]